MRNFDILIVSVVNYVNNVCKLLQLLTGASPLDLTEGLRSPKPPKLQPQMKIPGPPLSTTKLADF